MSNLSYSSAMRIDELARLIDAEVVGDSSIEITAVATLDKAESGQVSFLSNPKYQKQLATTRASAVIVGKRVTSDRPLTLLKTADPYYAFSQAVVVLHGYHKHPLAGIHPRANIDPTATIGANTIIYPGVYVGPQAKIGRECILYPNVVVYNDCVLGDRVTVHAGTVIGQDGFGYATHNGEHHKIPQAGNVVIEDDVEVGSNTVIERAALGSTVVGKGTKIDGLVTVGHGSQIGACCLLVSQVGIAGSVTLGHHVTLAGQVGVAGHLKIGNNVTAGGKTAIITDIEDGAILFGAPAMPAQHARRVYALVMQLPELLDRIRRLEQQVEDLTDSGDMPIA